MHFRRLPFLLAALTLATALPSMGQSVGPLKPMYLETALAQGGQANCVIAVPEGAAYAELASRLATAVAGACGVAPPVMPAAQVTDETLRTKHVIALGVFALNPVCERLYLRQMIRADYGWPTGAKSYELRTVHNPWLTGTNVMTVGSVTAAGLQAGVDRLIELLGAAKGGTLGPLIEVSDEKKPASPDAAALANAEKRIDEEPSSRTVGAIAAGYADDYWLSGDPAHAHLFLRAMRKLDALYAAEGAADDVRTCQQIFQQFDRIEEGPAFSEADRRELTDIFYRFAGRMTYAQQMFRPSAEPHGNNWNATGAAFAGMYLSRYYPDLELGQRLINNLDTYYAPNMQVWKVNEDCPGYGDITLTGNYLWSLHRPVESYFKSDAFRRAVDFDLLISTPFGSVSGFGDASGFGSYLVSSYPLAAWLYKDGRYLWWWDQHGGAKPFGWVPPEVLPRQRPEDLVGLRRAPLDRWLYDRRAYERERAFPLEQCFDKATFRSGLEPTASYLCLSGVGYGFHSHPDANAIINYSAQGQTFLFDDGYMIPSLSEHNSITVLKDGWAGHIPELSQIRAEASFGSGGIFMSRLSGYNGVDWDRCVISPDGRYTLVIDDLTATAPGSYNFQCVWRTLGQADLQGRRWVSEREKGQFTLIACSGAALSQKQVAGGSLDSPPRPLSEGRKLVEAAGATLSRGQSYQFGNVFYATPAGARTQSIQALQLADTSSYVIRDGATVAVAGLGSLRLPGASLRATAFHLTPERLTAAGLTRARVAALDISADQPVSLQLDLRNGRAAIATTQPVTVTYGGGKRTLEVGRQELLLPKAEPAALAALNRELAAVYAQAATGDSGGVAPAAGAGQGLKQLWRYGDFTVTQNLASRPGVKVNADRIPLVPAQAGYPVGRVPDLLHSDGNVMFPDGQTVRVEIDLGTRQPVHAVTVNSRQLRKFNGGCGVSKLTVWASNDGFRQDVRQVAEQSVTETPTDRMVPYRLELPGNTTARFLRIEAVAYSPTHNVYLDSIEAEGIISGDKLAGTGFCLNGLETADVNHDGKDEVFTAGSNQAVTAIGPDGKGLWNHSVPGVVNALALADTTGRGDYEIVAGGRDMTLHSINPDGSPRWTERPPARTYARPGYRGVQPFQSPLTVVFAADLDGDKVDEIVVGSANWRTYVYNALGKLLWDEVCWAHTPTCGTAFDFDGDGKREVVVANSYTYPVVYSASGKILVDGGDGYGGTSAVAAGDLNGNGKGELVVGLQAGPISFRELSGRPMPSWDTGSDVKTIKLADLNGDGKLETVAASRNYLLYAFDCNGQPLWQTNLLDAASDLAVGDVNGDSRPEIVCACEDGLVKVVDATGKAIAWYQTGGWVRQVRVCELDGNTATREIAATCDDGGVYGLQME